jgi:hypothetical protein
VKFCQLVKDGKAWNDLVLKAKTMLGCNVRRIRKKKKEEEGGG